MGIEGHLILLAQRPDRAVRQGEKSQARARPVVRLRRRGMGEDDGLAIRRPVVRLRHFRRAHMDVVPGQGSPANGAVRKFGQRFSGIGID